LSERRLEKVCGVKEESEGREAKVVEIRQWDEDAIKRVRGRSCSSRTSRGRVVASQGWGEASAVEFELSLVLDSRMVKSLEWRSKKEKGIALSFLAIRMEIQTSIEIEERLVGGVEERGGGCCPALLYDATTTTSEDAFFHHLLDDLKTA
jgi:hypothetical protein